MKERDDDRELPVVNPRGGDVEAVYVHREEGDEVREHRNGKRRSSETAQTNEADEVW